jgi:hypothetical protein
MNVENRIKIEKQIVRKIAKDAIAAGMFVSVHDGEDYALCRSQSVKAIVAACMSTDEDRLFFSDADGKRKGWVFLVYGNDGWDVVNDNTDNDATNAILVGATALATKLESQFG